MDKNFHDNCYRISELMIQGMQTFVKETKIKAEPAAMYRWYKEAEGVFTPEGKLMVWTPEFEKPSKEEKDLKLEKPEWITRGEEKGRIPIFDGKGGFYGWRNV